MAIIKKIRQKTPDVDRATYIAENSFLSGDVMLSEGVTIWPGVVVRADIASVIIGENTNIQDNSVIHVGHCESSDCSINRRGHVIIGKNTTVGHAVIIHACQIGNNCLVGMGAILLDDVIMEDGSMVAAGALVTPRTIVKSGQLWGGSPAKYMRDLRGDEVNEISSSAPFYRGLGEEYR